MHFTPKLAATLAHRTIPLLCKTKDQPVCSLAALSAQPPACLNKLCPRMVSVLRVAVTAAAPALMPVPPLQPSAPLYLQHLEHLTPRSNRTAGKVAAQANWQSFILTAPCTAGDMMHVQLNKSSLLAA